MQETHIIIDNYMYIYVYALETAWRAPEIVEVPYEGAPGSFANAKWKSGRPDCQLKAHLGFWVLRPPSS